MATLTLLKTLTVESLSNTGTFPGLPNTAWLLHCVIPAHAYRHMEILHQRYGP